MRLESPFSVVTRAIPWSGRRRGERVSCHELGYQELADYSVIGSCAIGRRWPCRNKRVARTRPCGGCCVGVKSDPWDVVDCLLRSRPPYTTWKRTSLDRSIGGPLLTTWGNRYVVGGRKKTPDRGPKTFLCWLDGDRLTEFAELPSGGDNSYPGLVEISRTRALVSYYSSHERDASGQPITAIDLAELLMRN